MQTHDHGVNLAPGSPHRRLLAALKSGPADLDQLAAEVDLHRSVVHAHLRRLRDAGLVGVDRKASLGPGRPAHVYTLSETALESSWPARQHRLLAAMLGRTLAGRVPNARRLALHAGVQYGHELRLTGLAGLEALGWEYRVAGEHVVTSNCAFREACGESDGIACHLHAGMLQVALGRRIGIVGRVDSGCHFRLGSRLTAAGGDAAGEPVAHPRRRRHDGAQP